MTRVANHSVSIAIGLPSLCMLLLAGLAGCSAAGSSSSEDPDSVVQQELSWSGTCAGHTGHECSNDKTCVTPFSRSCPGHDHPGICIARPHHCPAVSDPVCGCDGKTYDNLCEAASAGAAMEHQGACAAPPACGSGGTACPGAGTCSSGTSPGDGHGYCGSLLRHFPFTAGHGSVGVCECNATTTCGSGQRFNDSPAVCACEPSAGDPCAGVTCKAGSVCLAQAGGAGSCQPDPCNGVTCKVGDQCVRHPDGTATCDVDPCASLACKSGQHCTVRSDGTPSCQ